MGLPYLRAKAQDYYEAIGGGIDHEDLGLDVVEREITHEVRGITLLYISELTFITALPHRKDQRCI